MRAGWARHMLRPRLQGADRGAGHARCGRHPGLAQRQAGIAAAGDLRLQHAQAGLHQGLVEPLAQDGVGKAAAGQHHRVHAGAGWPRPWRACARPSARPRWNVQHRAPRPRLPLRRQGQQAQPPRGCRSSDGQRRRSRDARRASGAASAPAPWRLRPRRFAARSGPARRQRRRTSGRRAAGARAVQAALQHGLQHAARRRSDNRGAKRGSISIAAASACSTAAAIRHGSRAAASPPGRASGGRWPMRCQRCAPAPSTHSTSPPQALAVAAQAHAVEREADAPGRSMPCSASTAPMWAWWCCTAMAGMPRRCASVGGEPGAVEVGVQVVGHAPAAAPLARASSASTESRQCTAGCWRRPGRRAAPTSAAGRRRAGRHGSSGTHRSASTRAGAGRGSERAPWVHGASAGCACSSQSTQASRPAPLRGRQLQHLRCPG